MGESTFSLFLAGDALITRLWSQVRDPDFLDLVETIRKADVSITNLETVIHEFKGYAQAEAGGTYLASPPEIAAELKWAGFDMVAHANNHAFDYGSTGVLETLEHVERAGLILAGSGKDLQEARAPRYVNKDGRTVALTAAAESFIPYGRASFSRHDMPGRPGLNPLRLTRNRALLVPRPLYNFLKRFAGKPRWDAQRREELLLKFGIRLRPGDRFGRSWGKMLQPADLKPYLDSISEAASKADIVVASLHAHGGGKWLRRFARQAIDHGASIVFVHGPHHVLGVELYRRRPVFYSMGDFVYESRYVTRHPAEAYEDAGLAPDAPVSELNAADRGPLTRMYNDRKTYEGFAAALVFSGGEIAEIRLLPLDLQFKADDSAEGRPRLAAPELGRRIIEEVAQKSRAFGTAIRYDPAANCGWVLLGRPPP